LFNWALICGGEISTKAKYLVAEPLYMRESNPSEPATISVLLGGFQHKKGENIRLGRRTIRIGPLVTVYLCYEGTDDQG
jgi:hypothetical protein